jgi:hypothetical protein
VHAIARVLAVAYLALGGIAAVVYVQTSITYVEITEVNLNIDGRVAVSRVDIYWNRSSGAIPVVKVFITATNPGRVPIEVTNIDFQLHMDDPNDYRPWYDEAKLAATSVRSGGNTTDRGHGVVIPPGETRSVEAIVPIQGQDQMDRFDKPDPSGRYHPIVMGPRFVYFFVGYDVNGLLFLAPYYDAQGVLPIG